MSADFRPSPVRASGRQRLLGFLKARQAEGNGQASEREMAEAVGCSRKRVRDYLAQLEREQRIVRNGRARGVVVVDEDVRAEIFAALTAIGWTINDQDKELTPPEGPKTGLPFLGPLAYLPDPLTGTGHGDDGRDHGSGC